MAGTRPPPQAGRQVTWGAEGAVLPAVGPPLSQGLLSGSPCAGKGRDSFPAPRRPEQPLCRAQPGSPPSLSSAGRNLKEWLREQFCDHPIEHCEDTRLHDAAYVGDLPTLKSLLQEESFQR